MKYSEATRAIVSLSRKYSINVDMDNFNVKYKGEDIAYVPAYQQYFVKVWIEKYFSKLPFSNKLYMILSELAMTPLNERVEAKKYYVKVFNNEFGYLNLNIFSDKVIADNKSETDSIKTKFTLKEIEQLKQREDVALDWKKVTLVEVD